MRALFCALLLTIWLGLDFHGLFASVLGPYFYFGMKGTPYHELKIVSVALLTVGGPLI